MKAPRDAATLSGHVKHVALIAALAAALSGCGGGGTSSATGKAQVSACPEAWQAGWQRLADRIQAPVYCPGWLPTPLTAKIGGPYAFLSVSPARSYLVTFLDQHEGYELHATMRGYPGRTSIPVCRLVNLVGGKKVEGQAPCFAKPSGIRRAAGITATVYTENQDADEHHLVYAWRYKGALYALGHHAHHSIPRRLAVANLDRMLRSLAVVRPRS